MSTSMATEVSRMTATEFDAYVEKNIAAAAERKAQQADTFLFDGHEYTLNEQGNDTLVTNSDGELVCTVELMDEYYYVIGVDNEAHNSSHEGNHESDRDAVIMLASGYISGCY